MDQVSTIGTLQSTSRRLRSRITFELLVIYKVITIQIRRPKLRGHCLDYILWRLVGEVILCYQRREL